jgi:hypothetical protein
MGKVTKCLVKSVCEEEFNIVWWDILLKYEI